MKKFTILSDDTLYSFILIILVFLLCSKIFCSRVRADSTENENTDLLQFVWRIPPAEPWHFNKPEDVAIDGSGNIYVADTDNHRIEIFNPNGNFLSARGSKGSDNGQFMRPSAIAINDIGNIYVADSGNHRIQKFSSEGPFLMKWGSLGSDNGQFMWLKDITVDGSGNIYVADSGNDRIQKFDPNGTFLLQYGE